MTFRPFTAVVEHVERLCPTFARITFTGPELSSFGPAGPVRDLRIKLIFPTVEAPRPRPARGDDWYTTWKELPDDRRGAMRTYSVRQLSRAGQRVRLTVDFVLHLAPGACGPASAWAAAAAPGDELTVIGPDTAAPTDTGIEFRPAPGASVHLYGDETAAPAIARIVEDLSADATGSATIEVPEPGDTPTIAAPAGVELTWLPRAGAAHGDLLAGALARRFPGVPRPRAGVDKPGADAPLIWETPNYSSSGELLGDRGAADGAYYWIAGESGMVKQLRRFLVAGAGVDRAQISFMGYWRRGVAMKG